MLFIGQQIGYSYFSDSNKDGFGEEISVRKEKIYS